MLKISVEELWHLELEQLRNHESISSYSSNIQFDLQVPSTYTCRAVLPMASEIQCSKNDIISSVNSSFILQPSPTASNHEIISNKMRIKDKIFQSISQKSKFIDTFHLKSKKQKRHEFNDNIIKFWTKKALLHLKFQCSQHMH
ncbi:unnamed protein product [Rotaria sordida]|uniref:Uncharacterized protein n=1 Tax=Rotaria sordida TaxID=392033 RepID=A0A815PPQ0_9BILA|nr:unnamed protein product [Rotaria sordida]CAF1187720.1 unnamed protein product [Rotaria sordida]CAF1451130.1 unnamed protein product [Rotaria sordida]CAF1452361.1 unnamed protein product [Rotaria sordida]